MITFHVWIKNKTFENRYYNKLYESIINLVLSKNILVSQKLDETIKYFTEKFYEICFNNLSKNKILIDRKEINLELIKNSLNGLIQIIEYKNSTIIELQFYHLSFLEYFTSQYVVKILRKEDIVLLKEKIEEILNKSKSRTFQVLNFLNGEDINKVVKSSEALKEIYLCSENVFSYLKKSRSSTELHLQNETLKATLCELLLERSGKNLNEIILKKCKIDIKKFFAFIEKYVVNIEKIVIQTDDVNDNNFFKEGFFLQLISLLQNTNLKSIRLNDEDFKIINKLTKYKKTYKIQRIHYKYSCTKTLWKINIYFYENSYEYIRIHRKFNGNGENFDKIFPLLQNSHDFNHILIEYWFIVKKESCKTFFNIIENLKKKKGKNNLKVSLVNCLLINVNDEFFKNCAEYIDNYDNGLIKDNQLYFHSLKKKPNYLIILNKSSNFNIDENSLRPYNIVMSFDKILKNNRIKLSNLPFINETLDFNKQPVNSKKSNKKIFSIISKFIDSDKSNEYKFQLKIDNFILFIKINDICLKNLIWNYLSVNSCSSDNLFSDHTCFIYGIDFFIENSAETDNFKDLCKCIKQCKQLNHVVLSSNDIHCNSLIQFFNSLKMSSSTLVSLKLRHCCLRVLSCLSLSECLKKLTKLRNIDLSFNTEMKSGLQHIFEALKYSPYQLQNVSLVSSFTDVEQIERFCDFLNKCTSLEDIDLSKNRCLRDHFDRICHGLSHSKKTLSKLNFSYCELSAKDHDCIGKLINECERLIEWDLSGNMTMLDGFKEIYNDSEYSLTTLKVCCCSLNEEKCRWLSYVLKKCVSLRDLDLQGNKNMNNGFRIICFRIKSFPFLKKLNLSDCSLSSAQCDELGRALEGLKSLQSFNLSSNKNMGNGFKNICYGLKASSHSLKEVILRDCYFQDTQLKWLLEIVPISVISILQYNNERHVARNNGGEEDRRNEISGIDYSSLNSSC